MADDLFAVWQFFADDTSECIRCGLCAKEAVETAQRYCKNVGARIGTTKRVIITDGGDYTVFEWRFGIGVTFPVEAHGAQPR